MTWTTPATPVSGTAITVAFYSTNIKDNLNHLRTLTGGDPGAAGNILVSTSTVAASWTSSPSLANLTLTSGLTMNANISMGSGNKKVVFATEVGDKIDLTGTSTVVFGVETQTQYQTSDGHFSWRNQAGVEKMHLTHSTGPVLTVGGSTVCTAGNDGSGSGLDADLLDGHDTAFFAAATALTAITPSVGSYIGNGATAARQQTLGFIPSYVIIAGGTSTGGANVAMAHIISASGAVYSDNGGNVIPITSAHFHGSDGITYADGDAKLNTNGVTYKYVAFR